MITINQTLDMDELTCNPFNSTAFFRYEISATAVRDAVQSFLVSSFQSNN